MINAIFHFRIQTQVPCSQISKFFSKPAIKDSTQWTAENETANTIDSIDAAECSENVSQNCDKQKQSSDSDETQTNASKTQTGKKSTKTVHRTDTLTNDDTKSTIKSFFSNENNDSMLDFEIPAKVVKKAPKPLSSTKTAKGSRARRKQLDIRKALGKQNAANDDYSHLSEEAQLELALAISKTEATDATNQPFSLEAFEFKPTNSNANENFFGYFSRPKKTNARFKWNSKCTQLTRRNDDAQKQKVREKIDEMLVNNIIVESRQSKCLQEPELFSLSNYSSYEIYSKNLQRICVPERILFELNGCAEHSGCNILSYYTNNLVERTDLRAGVLLRDWSKIPGRDSIYDGFTTSATTQNDHMNTDTESDSENIEMECNKTDYATVITSQCQPMDNCVADNDQINVEKCLEAMERIEDEQIEDTESIEPNENPTVDDEYQNSAGSSDDEDVTFVLDSNDIQLKVDAINSKIRLSQSCSDFFDPAILTYDTAATTRAISPDLFDDDDDDIDMDEEIRKHFSLNFFFFLKKVNFLEIIGKK